MEGADTVDGDEETRDSESMQIRRIPVKARDRETVDRQSAVSVCCLCCLCCSMMIGSQRRCMFALGNDLQYLVGKSARVPILRSTEQVLSSLDAGI